MRRSGGATASLVGSGQGRAERGRGFLPTTIAFWKCSGRGIGTVPIPSPGLILLFQKADPATCVSPVQGCRGVLGGPRLGCVRRPPRGSDELSKSNTNSRVNPASKVRLIPFRPLITTSGPGEESLPLMAPYPFGRSAVPSPSVCQTDVIAVSSFNLYCGRD